MFKLYIAAIFLALSASAQDPKFRDCPEFGDFSDETIRKVRAALFGAGDTSSNKPLSTYMKGKRPPTLQALAPEGEATKEAAPKPESIFQTAPRPAAIWSASTEVGSADHLEISPANTLLAVQGGILKVYEPKTGNFIGSATLPHTAMPRREYSVSPKGTFIVGRTEPTRLQRTSTNKRERPILIQISPGAKVLAVHDDGGMIVVDGKTALIYDSGGSTRKLTLDEVNAGGSPDLAMPCRGGNQLAVAVRGRLDYYDLKTFKKTEGPRTGRGRKPIDINESGMALLREDQAPGFSHLLMTPDGKSIPFLKARQHPWPTISPSNSRPTAHE